MRIPFALTGRNMDAKLEIRHLKLLAAVAEEGSVTKAGMRLHLTQSALSHQLRDAEERVGSPLFLRIGKRMTLTPSGEQLLVCARRILEDLASTESQIRALNGGARGVIRRPFAAPHGREMMTRDIGGSSCISLRANPAWRNMSSYSANV